MRTHPLEENTVIPHTPDFLRKIFARKGIVLNKKYGQHILIDQNILSYIATIASLQKDDVVLEIGTGTGSLTRFLAERAGHVFTVEIDNKLFELSSEILKLYKNITIINADILRSKHKLNAEVVTMITDWLVKNNNPVFKVVSNLPYNISTPVIINLLESNLPISLMVLMLQKEITERLAAAPGSREYGILSVITQLFSEVELMKTLPPEVFWPRPEVSSAIVKMSVNKAKFAGKITDYPLFTKIIFAIFTSRRKTLLNSIEKLRLPGVSRNELKKILISMQLDEHIRGEILNLEQLLYLTEAIHTISRHGNAN
ncbi:MAG: ribosomal RNA small subunit methyltransferase A [Planctomycetes bacterium]|nr:ribosomal RNA small subunit methyltransferase A [Planctomycetota bacterium]